MRILRLLLRPSSLATTGAVALILLAIWIGSYFGLALPWIMVSVLVIVAAYAFLQMVLRMRTARAGTQLERSMEEQGKRSAQAARPGRESEIAELHERLLTAISALRASRVGKVKGAGALYVLPWYMIIGPPASGKTTLLENSGLNFPYLDPAKGRSSVRGVGGTRNCDWWFADEAVLIDTAGRYVLPVEADDSTEWLGFLDLLRKHRGRKPINGLVVGISISDLLQGSEEEAVEHAKRIRGRIDELIQRLGISFPVYVLFTKCDLIRGFVESFGDLSKVQRAQALGATVALSRSASTPARRIFDRECERLAEALDGARAHRLSEMASPEGRPEVLFFPLQFRAVQPRLSRFMDVLFQTNPYQEAPIFRGFYFTSGTQEGRPIDSVINAMLRGFGIAATTPGMSVEPSQAKSYFIEDVFSKVVFPDRALAGPSALGERRRRAGRVKAFTAGAVALGILALALFGLSATNRRLLMQVRTLSDRAQAAAVGSPSGLGLADVRVLDQLRDRLDALDRRSRPLAKIALLGTSYRADQVETQGGLLLLASLRKAVIEPYLPVLLRQMSEDPGGDFFRTYDRYRTWRIMQDPATGLRTADDAARVAGVLADHWSSVSGGGSAEEYAEPLRALLGYATTHPALVSDVFPPGRSADPALEERVRAHLRGDWSADGLRPRLLAQATEVPAVSLAGLAGNESGLQSSVTIPGAYTTEGWKLVRGFLQELGTIRTGAALRAAFGSEPPDLGAELLVLYQHDYVKAWTAFLSDVDVRSDLDPVAAQAFLERASGDKSPILAVLREASKNTDFGSDGGELRPVTEAFGAVHEFFRAPGKGTLKRIKGIVNPDKAPADEYLALLGALKGGFAAIAQAPDPSGAKEVLDIEGWVETRLPGGDPVTDELARFLRVPVHVVKGTVRQGRGKGVSTAWSLVVSDFQRNLAGRYPVEGGGSDAALADFEAFFGPSGTFWTFYRENLAKAVSEDGSEILDPSVPIAPELKICLARALRIRRALFPSGAGAGFTLSLRAGIPRRPAESGLVPRETRLEIGGDALIYQLGAQTWRKLSWPGPNSAQGATVRLTASNASGQPLEAEGVWGFFRILDRARIRRGAGNSLTLSWTVQTDKGDVEIPYDVGDLPAVHPLESGFLRFSCPSRITTGAP
jgi:type VI secretion system protein ImpL